MFGNLAAASDHVVSVLHLAAGLMFRCAWVGAGPRMVAEMARSREHGQ